MIFTIDYFIKLTIKNNNVHLEVTAGQDGHPLFPLKYMDDAASTAHLCCQGGSDRLIGPASFPWISHGNGRSYLDFVMAWSWGCVQRCIEN